MNDEGLAGGCCRSCRQQIFGISPTTGSHAAGFESQSRASNDSLSKLLEETLLVPRRQSQAVRGDDSLTMRSQAPEQLREQIAEFLIEDEED